MQPRLGLRASIGVLFVGALGAQSVVKDINIAAPSFAPSSSPTNMLTVGGTTYFAANDGFTGSELWKTDGTGPGTMMVKDINPGAASSSPASLTLFNGFVYFAASTAALSIELWRTDGTALGTVLIADCYPGTGSSNPSNLTVNGLTMFFSAFDGTAVVGTGRELWKTDGTTLGTVRITDLFALAGSSILSVAVTSYAPWGTGLLFPATNGTTVNNEELWYSDGTTLGTVMVKDIFAGTSAGAPRFLTPFGTKVYFTATDGTAAPFSGVELWETDGTTLGTLLVKDIYPGFNGSIPSQPIVSAGKMFFSANNATALTGTGRELYVSDGTTLGTVLVTDLNPLLLNGIASQTLNIMVPFGTGVLVGMSNGTLAGQTGEELWFSDGTAVGTVLVADISPLTASSSPRAARVVGTRVFFAATTVAEGYELYVTDGTGPGTVLTRDIFPLASAGLATTFPSAGLGTSLVFAATTGTVLPNTGVELWISDGTLAGTVLVKDIAGPQASSSNPINFAALGKRTVFSASDGVAGIEPWVTDGTVAGTVMLMDAFPGASNSSPANFTTLGDKCFFTATNTTATVGLGTELYITDGTPGGTQLLLDINPGTLSSSPINLVVSHNKLFFLAITALNGRELWRSDGTAAGTVMVADFNPGAPAGAQSFAQSMAPFGNGVIFSGISPTAGGEICVSDGTAAGTVAIDWVPGLGGADPSPFITFGGYAYTNATNGASGFELVRTDGTLAGTSLVKDIVPGALEGNPGPFAVLNNKLYFFATEAGTTGTELWVSDGTTGGTMMLVDINPGAGSSVTNSPFAANLIVARDRLFFPANDGTNGIELWSSDGTAAGTTLARNLNPGAGNGVAALASIVYPAGLGTKVLFAGDDGVGGFEPCLSNGTLAGTNVIADHFPGPVGSAPGQFLVNHAAAAVYFAGLDPVAGREPLTVSAVSVGAALADVFGTGCYGTTGVPRIGITGVPQIGSTFSVTLSNAPALTWCPLFLNGARADLAVGGGCTSYPLQPAFDVWRQTGVTGAASVVVAVPVNVVLVGFEVFNQWVTFDTGGAFFNALAFTAGLHVVIGQP